MAQTVNINFHQTFKPEAQYITAILDIASDGAARSVKEISQMTGIPNGVRSGKVEPHICYAYFMGLITFEKEDGGYRIQRTSIGESVYTEDPGLQEKLTILLLHTMITREIGGAIMWSTIFRNILPRYKMGIRRDMVMKELNSIVEGNFTIKNIAPFYGSYETFFAPLGVLNSEGDIVRLSDVPFDKEYIFLYAYILFEYWDERYADQDEISSDQLEKLHFRNVFGWDSKEEYELLEQLNDKGIIRLNRQLMPYTILRLSDKGSLIGKLYSELC